MIKTTKLSPILKFLFTQGLVISLIGLTALLSSNNKASARDEIIEIGNTPQGNPVYLNLESHQGHSGLFQLLIETRSGGVTTLWYQVSCSEKRIFEMDIVLSEEGQVQYRKYVKEVSSADRESIVYKSMVVLCQQRGATGW